MPTRGVHVNFGLFPPQKNIQVAVMCWNRSHTESGSLLGPRKQRLEFETLREPGNKEAKSQRGEKARNLGP